MDEESDVNCVSSLPDLTKDYGKVGSSGWTNGDAPLPVLPSNVDGVGVKARSCASRPVLPSLTEGDKRRTNSVLTLTVLPSAVEGDASKRNRLNSPPVLPTDSSDRTNLTPSLTVLPRSVVIDSTKSSSSNSLSVLPMNFMDSTSMQCISTTSLTVLPTYADRTPQCNNLILLPVLPTHTTEGGIEYRHNPSLPVLPSQAGGNSNHSINANSYAVLPAKGSEGGLTVNSTPEPALPDRSGKDREEGCLTRPLLSVLSTSLMENNNNQTSNRTLEPAPPNLSAACDRERNGLPRPLLSVLSTSLQENTAQATDTNSVTSQSLLHRLFVDGKLNGSLSASSGSRLETDSDQNMSSLPLPSSNHSLPYHITEDVRNQSNQLNRSTTLPVSPPLMSQPSTLHHTPSVSQSTALPSSDPQTLDSSHHPLKRKRRKNSDGTDVRLNVASEHSPPPSYSYCIASAVENILIECPEDVRQECGQQILTAAMKILVEMKKEEEPTVALME